MNYAIECKDDLLTGATLIVKIPENEIDKKALFTIQTDMPPFMIPFHHYCSDGEALFVYNIGMFCKLQYMTGNRAAKEYAQLWISVLNPLLECTDWFMQPNAFLLDAEYLYYDKDKNSCCFIYIPSIRNISEHTQLKELAADVSKFISVDDVVLENKVLRAIMKNFDPDDLLKTLRTTMTQNEKENISEKSQRKADMADESGYYDEIESALSDKVLTDIEYTEPEREDDNRTKDSESLSYSSDEIVIEFPENRGYSKKDRGQAKEKKQKEKKESRNKVGVLGGLFDRIRNFGEHSDHTMQAGHSFADNSIQDIYEKKHHEPSHFFPNSDMQMMREDIQMQWETETQSLHTSGVRLRSIGRAEFPLFIEVDIEDGEIFSIGKFDAAIGRPQSSFEFGKKTKGVSRRHCIIKRVADEYILIDLNSSAGTFVNNERLPPNTACKLINGCRISLGNSGADYVWEMGER